MSLEVITFGCRLNIYESEVIKNSAKAAGLDNAIIFNSCSVTKEAERQLQQSIRKTRRENPDKRIIVTGCAAQSNPDRYSAMQEVDNLIGNEEKNHASSYDPFLLDTEPVRVNDIMSIEETSKHIAVEGFDGKARGFLQVQNGCNHRCTFCSIPYGRGNSRSVPIAQIVLQAQKLVEKGYKELVITGVDLTDYGSNLPAKPQLGQMMKRLLNLVPDLERLRLSSVDVAEIDDDLLYLIEHEKRLMPHIHLSLQAGDNLILKRMKRRHNREQVQEFCNTVRLLRPDVVFGADIIAGFPTESEEMFRNTYDLIEECRIAHLHVFPYSERDGTPAARMPKVEPSVRKSRAKILRQLGAKILKNHHESLIGREVSVLVEREGLGKSEDFCNVVLPKSEEVGSVYSATVSSCDDQSLYVE